MKRKEVILIIDTETLGLYDKRIYDLGYVIYDIANDKIIKKRNYIIKQVFDNKYLMNSAYYKEKIPMYTTYLKNGKCKKVWLGIALKILMRDMKKYQVKKCYAYNSRFDLSAMETTCNYYNKKNPFASSGIIDIIPLINCITKSSDYIDFCMANNFLTRHKIPRPQKKAETLYRYLTNNVNYIEEHTALSDSLIELEILLSALNR